MACLLSLPRELSLEIIKLLDLGDKIHLSATCKSYRTQSLLEIFKIIRFGSDETSANSALIAVEAHGQYVKAMEFTCGCDRNDRVSLSGGPLITPSLLPAACKILKGHLTPNLQMVKLKFDFDLDDGEFDVDNFFGDVEGADTVRWEEMYHKWRALMNETWAALITNTFVRELILDQFIPKWTSTYYTDAFRQFLGQLESATFDIFGMEDYVGWHTNITQGYSEFLGSLDASFFSHMMGLKHLHILASDPLGLGTNESFYIPLALKPEDFPLLQSLKLERCFICPELVSFIQSHVQVLESLDVNECFCYRDLPWAEFFNGIYEAKPSLTELIAGGNKTLYITDEAYDWMDTPELRHIHQKLEADPTLKVFRYAWVDADEGILFPEEEINVKRFDQGDDQRAYGRLMGLVNKNREGHRQSLI